MIRLERKMPRAVGDAPAATIQRSPFFASFRLAQRVTVTLRPESTFSNCAAAHCACELPATGSFGSITSDTPLAFAARPSPAPRIADDVAVVMN